MNPADPGKAKAYERKKYFVELSHLVWQFFLLILILSSGINFIFKGWAEAATPSFYLEAALYFSLFFFLFWIFDVPFAFYSSYRLEHDYELSNQNLASWAIEILKKTLLSFTFSLGLVLSLYALIRRFPETWWVYAWAGFAGFGYLLGKLFPVLIVPLFYRYGRVEDEAIRARIFRLVERFRLPLENVYSLNLSKTTRKANAMFAGLGRTRRLVLADTLIENFTPEEIESVVAHELGHFKHGDVWRHLVFELAVSFAAFALTFQALKEFGPRLDFAGASDLAAFPFLCLILSFLALILTPLQNVFSRQLEREADRFALEAAGPSGFIPAMEKLGRLNLADPDPSRWIILWFHTHPPIAKRIEMARKFLSILIVFSLWMMPSGISKTEKESETERQAAIKALEARTLTEMKSFFLGSGKEVSGVEIPIALDLYNQAVEFYEKREYDLAREALQDSLRYDDKNPFAHELLGDIAYYQQRMEEALEHYEAAYRVKMRQDLKAKIGKIQKEKSIDSGLATYEEEHFIIKYRGESAGLRGAELKDFLRNSFREIGQDMGYFFRHQIVVLLYDEKDFRALSDVPHWSSGVYDGKIRLPAYRQGVPIQEVRRIIRHEMTHAFVGAISRGKCPAWLNEGLAEFEEAKVSVPDSRVFHAAIRSKSLFPLAELFDRKRILEIKDPLEAELFYQEAHQLVNYLVGRYGMFKIKQMLEAFGRGKDSLEVVEEVLKLSPLELEKRWRKTLPPN